MPKLKIRNVSVSANGKALVKDVGFELHGGKVAVIMGPNGSGKSSLANAVFGHPAYEITGGSIMFDGEDVTSLPIEEKAKRGMFLSMQHLPEIGGVTLASFMHKAHTALHPAEKTSVVDFYKKLEEAASEVGMDPGFLKRHVNVGLSGGERKLSEVLQLAVLKPKFAILDEIDSGVDVDSLKKVFGAISKLRDRGTGFLLITHYNSLLDHIEPDFVHIMKDGKLARSGGKELVREIAEKGFSF